MLIKPLEQSNHFGGGGTVFDGLCRILVHLFLCHADMDIAEAKFSHVLLYCYGFAFVRHDSAIFEQARMALAAPSVGGAAMLK